MCWIGKITRSKVILQCELAPDSFIKNKKQKILSTKYGFHCSNIFRIGNVLATN